MSENVTGEVDENGILTLHDHQVMTREMPIEAKDKNGNDVVLAYTSVDVGFDIQVIEKSEKRYWKNVL
ncbi:hypothetical protein DOS70_08485 [Staphylococcus felis]|uniref:Uncharacterized protein n=1 Tax=Staphylococcus felis TaxID=46127 RepID=A0A3E0IT68_9STAP|nr:hypothetical protein [Staphylococcus felis]MBH9580479.1 hypothetical protein [Staphylococcus felis]MDM8327588.1 hypothetical protein [Staphylococcus felis]MDQ7193812.1 hypothetical protein [Staphylococcus felis]REH94579.1 hypothetical protein DOS70_08485 [Staphylococcus felis]REI01658.1 hypothetical protein DOS83_00040 [Staphylococcus felis]